MKSDFNPAWDWRSFSKFEDSITIVDHTILSQPLPTLPFNQGNTGATIKMHIGVIYESEVYYTQALYILSNMY